MTIFRKSHPWNPGYALPANVLAESPGRGTLVTEQLPRRTISRRPRGWTGGYALPEYIQNEPDKRGAAHTHWLRRKTIPHTIASPLGAMDIPETDNPVNVYGQELASYIYRTMDEVPVGVRAEALEALLNQLQPGLPARVEDCAQKIIKRGIPKGQAYKAALAKEISKGFVNEVVNLGKGGSPKAVGYWGGPTAMAGWTDWVKKNATKIGLTVVNPVAGAHYAVGTSKTVRKKTVEWGGKVISTAGKMACKVLRSDAGKVGVVVGAAAAGAPPQAGVAGAQIGGQLCTDQKVPQIPAVAAPRPIPWVPIALGGAGLLAVLLLTR